MKAQFIYEAIKHLGGRTEEELLKAVEKEPILKQIKLMYTYEYSFLQNKLYPITPAIKKKIRQEISVDSGEGPLGILSWLKNNYYRYLGWLYTEEYNKAVKLAKTTKDITKQLEYAINVYEWYSWGQSQELQFPPVIDILLKRAKNAKLDVLNEDSVIYLYNRGKDVTYYAKFPFTSNNITIKPITEYTYSISFNEWGDFAQYFKESRDIDKDFIEKVLNGEGSDYFLGKYDYNDFPDFSFLPQIKPEVFNDIKEFVVSYHPEAQEFDDFYELYDFIHTLERKGDLNDKVRSLIIRAYNETMELAQEEEAYKDLKEAIIDHFDLSDIKHSKQKFRGKINKDGVKKLILLSYCQDAFEKQEVNYSMPYYGYSGDAENCPDIFSDAILNAIEEID